MIVAGRMITLRRPDKDTIFLIPPGMLSLTPPYRREFIYHQLLFNALNQVLAYPDAVETKTQSALILFSSPGQNWDQVKLLIDGCVVMTSRTIVVKNFKDVS